MGNGKMKIYEYKPGSKIPGRAVVALGLFDGVHIGHRLLLKSAEKRARELGLTFAVFTFPTETLYKSGGALYSTEDKLKLLSDAGVDAVILADFKNINGISAEDFVKSLLIGEMGCEGAVCGFDFKFGRGASGDAALLSRLMTECGKECIIESEHRINGEKISTTRIKELLGGGEVKSAKEYLGSPYFITSRVERGLGAGHGLGFPTVNLFADGLSHLKRGVYGCAVQIGDGLFSGVANVGTCPTLGERDVHAEINIIDFDGDLYGESIRVFFIDFLREERCFDSKESLILQIKVDKNRVIKEIGDISWQEIGLKLPQPEI